MAAIEMKCPPSGEILLAALGRDDRAATVEHIDGCASCRDSMNAIRESIGALQAAAADAEPAEHVSDDAIALLADGETASVSGNELMHIADCGSCRSRLTMLIGTMDDSSVALELRALEPRLGLNRSSRIPLRYVGGLAAAAAAAIVLLGPVREKNSEPVHREAAITATAAPRIVSPAELSSPTDSLRWTSLAQADLYRVRIWDSEGTVVWSGETRDTAIAVPAEVRPNVQYMWELDARTGWDRWVSSDLVALMLRSR